MTKPILLLLTITTVSACSERTAENGVPGPVPCEVEGMRNCAQVSDVVIGSQPSRAALESLAAQGYKTIVSTRGEGELDWDERAAVEALGMTFVSIPMNNPVTEITDEQVAGMADVMAQSPKPMLLHCGSGNRVAGLWGTWLAEHRAVDAEGALRLAELAGMTGVRPAVERRLGLVGAAR